MQVLYRTISYKQNNGNSVTRMSSVQHLISTCSFLAGPYHLSRQFYEKVCSSKSYVTTGHVKQHGPLLEIQLREVQPVICASTSENWNIAPLRNNIKKDGEVLQTDLI